MAQKRKRKDQSSVTEQMVEFHHYPTKSQFVRYALRYLIKQVAPIYFNRAMWEHQLRVLDHSCGTGVWNAVMAELRPDSYRVNVELQINDPIRPETAHEWHTGKRFQSWATSYLESPAIPLFDLVIGNGPFKELQEFIEWGYKLTRMGGYMFNLVPINFLGTQERTATLHRVLTPIRIISIPKRLSFTKDGRTDEKEYVLLVHQHGTLPRCAQWDCWFDWQDDAPDIPEDQPFSGQGELMLQPDFFTMDKENNRESYLLSF